MNTLHRRAFMTTAATTVIAPQLARAESGSSPTARWATLSLAERDAAFNNTLQVGPDIARKITEEWTAASAALRAQRPQHLALPYAPGERTKWDLFPASDPKAEKPSRASPKEFSHGAGRRRCPATRWLLMQA